MLLVSGSTKSVSRRQERNLGILLTPQNGNSVKAVLKTRRPWACDNGAFGVFDAEAFSVLLARVAGKPGLLWIACPDSVGDPVKTFEMFVQWQWKVSQAGPVAYVGQDGCERMNMPWPLFSAFFIGGSTKWKLSQGAADIASEAKAKGKVVHMGRVNSQKRLQAAFDMGCDSVDGTSTSMFGDTYIGPYLRTIKQLMAQPTFA
jgi:hypothetical protein